MRVGIGLPNTTPGTDRALLLEWARRADAGPFHSVAVLDRLVYESLEPFATLAAAAAVTERVRLATMIAIGPLRSPALLAKQAATVDAIAGGGRLTLGLAVGARRDDYEAAGVPYRERGARLSEQLAHLRGRCDELDLPLLVGGNSGAALLRMARYADG
ncbi:MAG TPA: LLM class flavin-dependent oxidoreductase, partial [Pseudonocardiaceae bacterium]